MGRLERRQAGAISTGVLGFMLLLTGVLLTVVERGGATALWIGGLGACILVAAVAANARVAGEMVHEGRR
jgi:hypothetical protein